MEGQSVLPIRLMFSTSEMVNLIVCLLNLASLMITHNLAFSSIRIGNFGLTNVQQSNEMFLICIRLIMLLRLLLLTLPHRSHPFA